MTQKNELSNNTIISNMFSFVCIFIIISGLAVRFIYYLKGFPFWADEFLLAENVVRDNLLSVFTGFDALQFPPPLFMFFTYINTYVFGVNVYSLRLIPFISGLLSLIFAYLVALKVYKNKISVIISLFIFAFMPALIYYSAEFKPYMTEMLVFLILIYLYDKTDLSNITIKKTIFYALCAFIICLSSLSSFFCLVTFVLLKFWERKNELFNKNGLIKSAILLSSLSCAAAYILWLFRSVADAEKALTFWNWISSFRSLYKIISDFLLFIDNPYNINILIFFIIAGALIFIYEKNKQAKYFLSCFLLACILALKVLNLYPLSDRVMLYLTPVFVYCTVKPIDIVFSNKNMILNIIKSVITIILCVLLFKSLNFSDMLNPLNINYWKDNTYRIEQRNAFTKFIGEYRNDSPVYLCSEGYDALKYYNFEKNGKDDIKIMNDYWDETMTDTCYEYISGLSDKKINWVLIDPGIGIDKEKVNKILKNKKMIIEETAKSEDAVIYKIYGTDDNNK